MSLSGSVDINDDSCLSAFLGMFCHEQPALHSAFRSFKSQRFERWTLLRLNGIGKSTWSNILDGFNIYLFMQNHIFILFF